MFSTIPPSGFDKEDRGDDANFYAEPRFVTHIDDLAISALTAFYRTVLPPGGVLLDLMSSWVSHLPTDVDYTLVIGHGMNRDELAANPRLTNRFVQDFNRTSTLPLESASIDAAMICVAIQYLQRPRPLLQEVVRVLRPGAPLVISFSNRCFPTKAVAIWRSLDRQGHERLVERYLQDAGFANVEVARLVEGRYSDPLTVVMGRT